MVKIFKINNMETKESLLKLAHICVGNKRFYRKESIEFIVEKEYIIVGQKQIYTCRDAFYWIDNVKDYELLRNVKQFDDCIGKLNLKQYTENTEELLNSFCIKFEDFPSLNINLKSKSETIKISEFFIDSVELKRKKSLKFWKKNDTKEISTGVKIQYNVMETKTEYWYEISSRSIVEKISNEEVEELYKKYNENKERLIRLQDESKIHERLEKYST